MLICSPIFQIKMLNRIATVKGDGTVVFEVPESVGSKVIDLGSEDAGGETTDEENLDVTDRAPLTIVMLIVGTRGDVQPFIAIGKRLQVVLHLHCLLQLVTLILGCYIACYVL